MNPEAEAKRAIAEASQLTGWHRYPVFCYRALIASFPSAQQRAAFITERRARYPKSSYSELPTYQ